MADGDLTVYLTSGGSQQHTKIPSQAYGRALLNAGSVTEIPDSVVSVPYASSVTLDASAGNIFRIGTLTGDITLNAPSNPPSSGSLMRIIETTQDGTGGRNITFNSAFVDPQTGTTVLLYNTQAANKRTIFAFEYNSTLSKWYLLNSLAPISTTNFGRGLLTYDGTEIWQRAGNLWDSASVLVGISLNDGEMHYTNFGLAEWDTNAYAAFKQGLGFFDTYDVGWPVRSVSSGTAYTLTTSPAALSFGTSNPVAVLSDSNENHEYVIKSQAIINYVGATFGSDQTITFKLRRTNNTAVDITDSTFTVNTQTMTTATYPGIPIDIFAIYDQASGAANDNIEIFASISALPSAGSVQIRSANILAYKTK